MVKKKSNDFVESITKRNWYLSDSRNVPVNASTSRVFQVFIQLGGDEGWLFFNWAWKIRGWFDKLIGGVGMGVDERDIGNIKVGDKVDFWVVEKIIQDQLLRFRAEMKIPGVAWLEFIVKENSSGQSVMSQTAYFIPNGIWGRLYWYGLYPIHVIIFSGMIKRIAKKAEKENQEGV